MSTRSKKSKRKGPEPKKNGASSLKQPSSSQKPGAQRQGSHRLRIIAGKWRGRQLAFPDSEGLRPTGARIRETLFNWLMDELYGATCLDAFAGSGALGFEALSREAARVYLVESHRAVAQQLQENIKLLEANDAILINQDCLSWLDQPAQANFDLVFLDPPFDADLWKPVIEKLEKNGWLAPEAWIYIETPKSLNFDPPTNWENHRSKSAGDVNYQLFKRKPI